MCVCARAPNTNNTSLHETCTARARYMKCLQLDQGLADAAFDSGLRDAMRAGAGSNWRRRQQQQQPYSAALPATPATIPDAADASNADRPQPLPVPASPPLTVVLDEAQDCSDCIVSLVLGQRRRGTVVVAAFDEHQTIYQFRHSEGRALAAAAADVDCALSTTFRFGAPLDRVATACVRFFKGVRGRGGSDENDEGDEGDGKGNSSSGIDTSTTTSTTSTTRTTTTTTSTSTTTTTTTTGRRRGEGSSSACGDGAVRVGCSLLSAAAAASGGCVAEEQPFLVRCATSSRGPTRVQLASEPPYLPLVDALHRAGASTCDRSDASSSALPSAVLRGTAVQPMAVLARRNATLFLELVRLLAAVASREARGETSELARPASAASSSSSFLSSFSASSSSLSSSRLRFHCVGGLDGEIGCGLAGALDVHWLKVSCSGFVLCS